MHRKSRSNQSAVLAILRVGEELLELGGQDDDKLVIELWVFVDGQTNVLVVAAQKGLSAVAEGIAVVDQHAGQQFVVFAKSQLDHYVHLFGPAAVLLQLAHESLVERQLLRLGCLEHLCPDGKGNFAKLQRQLKSFQRRLSEKIVVGFLDCFRPF